jgi:hypothetical protein
MRELRGKYNLRVLIHNRGAYPDTQPKEKTDLHVP